MPRRAHLFVGVVCAVDIARRRQLHSDGATLQHARLERQADGLSRNVSLFNCQFPDARFNVLRAIASEMRRARGILHRLPHWRSPVWHRPSG